MKFCEECGAKAVDEAEFCDECGAKFSYTGSANDGKKKETSEKSTNSKLPVFILGGIILTAVIVVMVLQFIRKPEEKSNSSTMEKEATTEESTVEEATTEESTVEEATTEKSMVEEATTEELTTETPATEAARDLYREAIKFYMDSYLADESNQYKLITTGKIPVLLTQDYYNGTQSGLPCRLIRYNGKECEIESFIGVFKYEEGSTIINCREQGIWDCVEKIIDFSGDNNIIVGIGETNEEKAIFKWNGKVVGYSEYYDYLLKTGVGTEAVNGWKSREEMVAYLQALLG